MKKLIASLVGAVALLVLFAITSAIGKSNTLLFLNWGEYIDETLLTAFEKKYDCNVVMDLGDSNEIFYSKTRAGTTVYDVVCPSDYMVLKMYQSDLLEELDFKQLPSFDKENLRVGVLNIYDNMDTNLKKLSNTYDSKNHNISNYFVPYLWGTWGIMYSTEKEGLEKSVTENKNQWASLFDRSATPAGTKIAMYDSHQHAYYAACRYMGLDATSELTYDNLSKMEKLIKNVNFDAWGTDGIKKDIVAGNIDLGFMWTGDFLYYYSENAAQVAMDCYVAGDCTLEQIPEVIDAICSDAKVYKAKSGKEYSIGFDLFIPDDTIAFCDNLVITKDSENKELAYKFIDFMISGAQEVDEEEINPAFTNTYYVDYDAPYISIYEEIVGLTETEFTDELDNSGDVYDSDLFWAMYDYAIGLSFDKYYPFDSEKGTILATFDRKYINIINTTFNNARA